MNVDSTQKTTKPIRPDAYAVTDPGKGNRSPALWGRWLLDKMGFQRQMLNAMQNRPMYHGTADAAKVAKRRAKNKVAKRSRRINRMAAKR